MEAKLDLILERLERLEKKVDIINQEIATLSKHAPFVDSLANSGVVSAIYNVNSIISSINPMKYIGDRNL
jgi:archaellum component FlaC